MSMVIRRVGWAVQKAGIAINPMCDGSPIAGPGPGRLPGGLMDTRPEMCGYLDDRLFPRLQAIGSNHLLFYTGPLGAVYWLHSRVGHTQAPGFHQQPPSDSILGTGQGSNPAELHHTLSSNSGINSKVSKTSRHHVDFLSGSSTQVYV